MARSRIARGSSLPRCATSTTTVNAVAIDIQRRRTRMSTTKVETDERVFVTNIDEAIGESGKGTNDAGQHLRASQWLEAHWRCRREDHLAPLPNDEQLVADQRDASGTELVLTPFDRAGLEFDRAQAGAEFLSAVVSVQVPVVIHAGRVVIRQCIVRRPDVHEFRALNTEHTSARSVLRRHKDGVADDEGCRG